jgi:hypothetical protein
MNVSTLQHAHRKPHASLTLTSHAQSPYDARIWIGVKGEQTGNSTHDEPNILETSAHTRIYQF